ncbi:MAG: hypothetical protein Q4F49_03525 [Pseudoxanthomonas suwonensis]|nr:hypothetical protein [Pseudoxanthomonas suwonensis]
MKLRTPATAIAATLLLSALPGIGNLEASTAIQRCQAGDGSVIYTDKPCGQLGAAPLPVEAALLDRIARDEAREQRDATTATASPATLAGLDPVPTATSTAPARRPVSAGCARTPGQLTQDLHAALALGDVNRVAESYAWMGLDNGQGQRILDRLQALTRQPVVNARYFGAPLASLSSGTAMQFDEATGQWVETAPAPRRAVTGGDGLLQLTVAGNGGIRQTVDFRVRRFNGCWFVQY